jgi:hypothetical protein
VYDFSLPPSTTCSNAPSGGSCCLPTELGLEAVAITKRVVKPMQCSACSSGSIICGTADPFMTSIQPLACLLTFHLKFLTGRMVLTASALGMKHLMSKTKQLLQEPAKDLEFDTGETEQKALIEASDIVTTFARLAKIYGSCSYSRPSSIEMFKMVGSAVLRIRRLEAVVKNLKNQRDDKKDAFKRAILTKAGGISRGDLCALTTCLTS